MSLRLLPPRMLASLCSLQSLVHLSSYLFSFLSFVLSASLLCHDGGYAQFWDFATGLGQYVKCSW